MYFYVHEKCFLLILEISLLIPHFSIILSHFYYNFITTELALCTKKEL
jgi:hypothetical protein